MCIRICWRIFCRSYRIRCLNDCLPRIQVMLVSLAFLTILLYAPLFHQVYDKGLSLKAAPGDIPGQPVVDIGPLSVFDNIQEPYAIQGQHDGGDPALKTLTRNVFSNTFSYIWCGQKIFTFRNYLSVLSVIRFMNPDNILFYYSHLPMADEEIYYNTWFDELKMNFPFLTLLPLQNESVCTNNNSFTYEAALKFVRNASGIILTPDIILSKRLSMEKNYPKAWNSVSNSGIITLSQQLVDKSDEDFQKTDSSKCVEIRATFENISDALMTTPCIRIVDEFYPKDIWNKNNSFGNIARTIFYGSPEIRQPRYDVTSVVPNIAHMIWIGGGKMDFLFYLGVLSMIYIVKVDVVYIHCDIPPSGSYWDRISNHSQIALKYRNFDGRMVFGQKVASKEHWSDVIRADVLYKYGGVYADTDAVFLRRFPDPLWHYEAVASLSCVERKPYPDSVVPGLMLMKPGAEFSRLLVQSMRDFKDAIWVYNPLQVPYKILERHPWTLHIEPRIQVVCVGGLCRPTWIPDYKNTNVHKKHTNAFINWRTDTCAFHFSGDSTPVALQSETNLLKDRGKTMFGQVGLYILQQSGLVGDLDVKFRLITGILSQLSGVKKDAARS